MASEKRVRWICQIPASFLDFVGFQPNFAGIIIEGILKKKKKNQKCMNRKKLKLWGGQLRKLKLWWSN
jgi:hypothetical protein